MNSTFIRQVPVRQISNPGHLSQIAQACLSAPLVDDVRYPPLNQTDAWRSLVANMERAILPTMLGGFVEGRGQTVERLANGVRVYDIAPEGLSGETRGVVLDIHGGAMILGSGLACRATASQLAERLQTRVCAVDYRMPPDYPYPAPLDDCLAAYIDLLDYHPASEIFVSGNSAGGNLAAALILRARDEGLPLPAGAILMTPEADLTESGDSFQTNLGVDTIPATLMPVNLLYANGHDLASPYLSPLFADFEKGFVPSILISGTRDLFLSTAVRMHRAMRKAGVEAELHLIEACGHVQFPGSPEAAEIDEEIVRFMARLLTS